MRALRGTSDCDCLRSLGGKALKLPTCTWCNHAHPTNSSLSSTAIGRTIGCDPENGRAWIICQRCGGWNLLRQEEGEAVTNELRMLLPASLRGGAILAIGDVEVVVVDRVTADWSAPTRSSLRTFKILRKLAGHRPLLNSLPYLLVALLTFGSGITKPSSIPEESWLFVGCMVVGVILAGVIQHLRQRRQINWVPLSLAVIGLAVLLVASGGSGGESWMDPLLVLSLVGLWALGVPLLDSLIPGWHPKYSAASYRSASSLREMTLSPFDDQPGVVVRGIAGMGDITGYEALRAIIAVSSDLLGSASPQAVDQGWILVRSTGGIHGLIRALEETRPALGSVHHWRSLPTPWKVAFHIAAIEAAEPPIERREFLRKVREQSDVARIAEDLDAELRVSGSGRGSGE